jgi:hypothetical protein
MRKEKKNDHSYLEWIQFFISFSVPIATVVYTILENNRDEDLQIADNQQKDLILHEYQKTLSQLVENQNQLF